MLLTVVGVVICVMLIARGYLVPVLVGGVVGSFFGVAGFGGAASGMLPGAIIGALVAKAYKSPREVEKRIE